MADVPEVSLLSIAKPQGLAYYLQRWSPSRTLGADPLQEICLEGRYVPVPIAGWKFTSRMARALTEQRVFKPLTFSRAQRLAVIIPIRDREAHLAALLPRLIAKLQQQDIPYRIIVVEQAPGKLWNKGAMLNAGVRHAVDHCDYYCLHDVDAIPIEANYACPSQPLRLVTKLIGSKQGAERPPRYFGGVITVLREQLYAANGFSNQYWAWGKEDDDFLFRLLFAGCLCYSDKLGTFEDLHNPAHQQVKLTGLAKPATLKRNRRRRSLLLRGLLDPADDGLNVVTTTIIKRDNGTDYQRLLVQV